MDYFKFDLQLFALNVTTTVNFDAAGAPESLSDTAYYAKVGTATAKWYKSIGALTAAAEAEGTTAAACLIATLDSGTLTINVGDSEFLASDSAQREYQYTQKVAQVTGAAVDTLAEIAKDGLKISLASSFSIGEGNVVTPKNTTAATVQIAGVSLVLGASSTAGDLDVATFYQKKVGEADKNCLSVTGGILYMSTDNVVGNTYTEDPVTTGSIDYLLDGENNVAELLSGEINVKAGSTIKLGNETLTAKGREAGSSIQVKRAEGDATYTIVKKSNGTRTSVVELTSEGASVIIGGSDVDHSYKTDGTVVTNTHASAKVYVGSNGQIAFADADTTFTVTDSDTTKTFYTVDATNKVIYASGVYGGAYKVSDLTKVHVTSILGQPDVVDVDEEVQNPLALANFAVTNDAQTAGIHFYKVYYKTGDTLSVEHVANEAAAKGFAGYFKVETTNVTGTVKAKVTFCGDDGNPAKLLKPVTIDFTDLAKVGTAALTDIDVSGITFQGTTETDKVTLTGVPSTVEDRIYPATVAADASYTNVATPVLDAKLCTINITGTTTAYYELYTEKKYGVTTYKVASTTTAESSLKANTKYFKVSAAQVGTSGTYNYTVALYDSGTPTIDINVDCLAGLVVDATGVTNAVSIAVPTQSSSKDAYAVKANVGAVVNTEQANVTATWTNTPTPTITDSYKDKSDADLANKAIPLSATANDTKYYLVTKTYPTNNGNPTIWVKEKSDHSSPPAATEAYFTVSTSADGKTATVTYHNGTGANDISLTGLKTKGESTDEPFKINLYGADGLESVVISDGSSTSSTHVDYHVSAKGGTVVKDATAGEDVVDYTGRKALANGVVIDLSKVTADTYYGVTATEVDGVVTYTRGTESATKPTDAAGSTAGNYFFVDVTTTDGKNAYTISYTKATLGTAYDLNADGITGFATVKANGDANISGITLVNDPSAKTVNQYNVTDATATMTIIEAAAGGTTEKSSNITYVDVYKMADGKSTIALAGITAATGDNATVYYEITKSAGTNPLKGVTTYELATLAKEDVAETKNYFKATVADGVVTLSYHKGSTGAIDEATLAKLTGMITVDATLAAGNPGKVAGIDLTEESVDTIKFAVTKLPADITVKKTDKSTVDYAVTYEMIKEPTETATDTITLTADKGTTLYYEVKAEGGNETKGVKTVSISKTAMDLSGKTSAQIAEILDATQGYFKVTMDENGAATVAYVQGSKSPADLTGLTVKVDATAVTYAGTKASPKTAVTVKADAADTGATAFAVSGLDVGQTVDETDGKATATEAFNETYAITGGIALEEVTAATLAGASSITKYYTVTNDKETSAVTRQGVLTYTVAEASNPLDVATAGSHYFAVKYSQYGVTVTYVNKDSDPAFDLATATGGKFVEVNADNVNKTTGEVTTIDITDTTGAVVNYALTNVDAAIEVQGAEEGKDTVTNKATVVLADNQKLTLGDKAITYYALSGVMDETTKKITATIAEGVETKPADTVNYFVVKRTVDSETKKVSYDVTYHVSEGGTAYNLKPNTVGKVTVDATGADEIALHNNGTNQYANFAVTGLKGGLTSTEVTGLATGETVSYTTAFAWAVGTYYLKDDTTKLKTGDGVTTEAGKTYTIAKVTYTETNGYNLAFEAQKGTPDANGFMPATGASGAATAITEITVDNSVTAIDATGLASLTIKGVAAGTVLKNVASTVTVTTAELDANTTSAPSKITIGDVDYVSGAANNTITVLDGKIKAGTLVLADGKTLTGAVADAASGTKMKTVTVTGGEVVVAFTGDEITGIKGLGASEKVTVTTNNTTLTQYSYEFKDGKIVRTDSAGNKTYAPATAETSDLLALDYGPETISNVGTFSWATAGKYYLADGAVIEDKVASGTVSAGSKYIIAEVTNGTGDEKILTLTPGTGVNGLVTPITDGSYTSTITVSADDTQVTYAKPADAAFSVAFTGAKAGSVFTGLTNAEDTVTTAALAIDNKITMKTWNEAGTAVDKTAVYTTAVAGEMTFTGGGLTSGTVTVAKKATSGVLLLSDGSTVEVDSDSGTAQVEVVGGTIKSITDLDNGEKIIVTNADGSSIKFEATSATAVTKTVTAADGSVTVTSLTIEAKKDVWAATGTDVLTNNFTGFDTKNALGYFKVTSDKATVTNSGAEYNAPVDLSTVGTVYIEAKIADVTDGVSTLTLTPKVVKKVDGKNTLVDAEGEADEVRVTVTATGTNKLKYNGTGNIFKADISGVVAGSEISGLSMGSTVTTAALDVDTTPPQSVTVNGVVWTTAADGAFTIYSDGTTSSRIVKGTIMVTKDAAVNAAEWDNTTDSTNPVLVSSQTLTYTVGSEKGVTYDGVLVVYGGTNGGIPQSITGLEKGAKVTIASTNAATAAVTTTTYQATTDETGYVYRTVGTVTTVKALSADSGNIYADTSYETLDTPVTKTFKWADAKPATTEPAAAATSTTGYFLMTDGKATVSDQSSAVTIDYKSFDKTYVVAEYSGDTTSNELTLNKKTVTYKGGLPTGTGAFAATDAVSVTVTGARKIVYARGAMKSIEILGAGAGSAITGAWNADDRITATLAGAKDATATEAAKPAETITLNGRVYTAGDTSTTVDVRGETVYNGTFLLQPAGTGADASKLFETVTAYKLTTDTDGTKSTTTAVVSYSGTDKAAVKVVNGEVVGLTGLEAGETVTIDTTYVDGFGNKTTASDSYVATNGTGEKASYIKVTKTTKDGTQYVHYFAKNTTTPQDVLASSVTWSIEKQTTVSTFDWNKTEATMTGYFVPAADGKTYSATIADQTGSPVTIPVADSPTAVGKTLVQITTEKSISGLITIKEAKLVVVQDNGTFADAPSNQTLTALTINLTGATGGVDFGEHTATLTVTNAATNATYTNLNPADTISGALAGVDGSSDKNITVGTQVFTVKDLNPPNSNAFTIQGDGKVRTGTFTVKDVAVTDAVNGATVTYDKTAGNGVAVKFAYTAPEAPATKPTGGIAGVTGLDNGEKVTITDANGTAIYTSDGTNVTKTLTATDGVAEKWTKTVTSLDATKGIYDTGYAPAAGTFTWADGGYGYFDAGTLTADPIATVATAGSLTTAPAPSNYYVRATVGGNKTDGYTVNSIKVLYGADLADKTTDAALKDKVIKITAPTDGGLTLADGAIATTTDSTGKTVSRSFVLNVDGAAAGMSYIGLGATDTVSAAALAKGETIKVGATAATAVEWSAAKPTAAVIYGDGAAKSGTFDLNSTYSTLTGKNPGALGKTVKTTAVKALTTATEARVTFASGAVKAIDYLGDGESVEVKSTDGNGRITTTSYTSAANGDGTFKITKVETVDGVTTTSVCAKTDAVSDVTHLVYTGDTATITSQFDWTAEKGAGYFEVTPTFDKTDKTKITAISDVTVDKQSTAVSVTAGKYYLKVALGKDGQVVANGVTLHKVDDDGKLGADLMAATIEGSITMNAPAGTALIFDAAQPTLAKVKVAIAGADTESNVTLKATDSLTTLTLDPATAKTAAEYVRVNNQVYTAGAAGAMKFYANTAGTSAVVADGAFILAVGDTLYATGENNKAGTTDDDKDNITVAVTGGTNTPIVTIENGKVTNITGLTSTGGTTVAATVAGGVSLTYGYHALAIGGTTTDKTIKTIPLEADTTVSYTEGTAKTVTTAQSGILAFVSEGDKLTLQSGVLKFAASTTGTGIALTGATTATTDDVALVYTAGATPDVTVTVANGTVTSVKGLSKGDVLKIGTTTYTATTDTLITKTVEGSTAGPSTATITKGDDIMKASFVGGGTNVVDEETGEYLAGQLNWAEVSGRSTSYFKLVSNKTTVQDQSAKVEVKPPKKDADTYLVASVAESDTVVSADGTAANVLTFSAISVDNTGKTSSTVKVGDVDTPILDTLTDATTVTVAASKTRAMVYDKAGAFRLTVKDLAANSVLTKLVTNDKVTTTTLETGNQVSVDGNVYVAGAKNALTIIGEANTAALLSGTIQLQAGTPAILAGASEKDDAGSATNDIGVIATGDGNVIVKAANGVVTSITGLNNQNATVEIRKYTTADHLKYTTVQYKVLDVDGKMIEMKTGTEAGWTADSEVYKQLSKAGAELDTAAAYKDVTKTSYKALNPVTVGDFNFASTAQVVSYIELGAAADLDEDKTIAKTGSADSDLLPTTTKTLKYDTYYLKVTGSKVDAKGVTTITGVDLMLTDANAKPAAVKVNNWGFPAYDGVLTIDGTTGTSTYAKVKYALPTGTKRVGDWTLNAKNVALGSTFTNLGETDKVDTVDGAWDFTNDGTSFVIYTNGAKGTNTQTVTYKGSVKNVKATVTDDALASVKGMTAGSLTVVTNADNAGVVTTVYEWKKVSGTNVLQRTITDAEGAVKVDTGTLAAGNDDIFAATWTDNKVASVVSDFDWTLDKSTTGYVKAAANTTFKTGKTTIKSTDTSTYIAVTLNGANEKDGEVAALAAMVFDTENGGMKAAADGAFTGKLTITAPTKSALKFDRGNAAASIAEGAQIVVNGALAGSVIAGLTAHGSYKNGDQVLTAALSAGKAATATTPAVAADTVTVNSAVYTAGANGKLTFTMQPVGEGSNLADQLTLTSGTLLLATDPLAVGTLGVDNAYVGNAQIMALNGASITVAATTNAKGDTTFTIGGLDENESFSVESPVGGTSVTYTKSGTTLFCKYATDQGDFTKVYAIGSAKTITSAVLAKAVTDTAKTPTWKTLNATFTADDNDFLTSKYGVVNVKLADFDSRYTKDKAAWANYSYVIDTYISSTTAESKTKALAASVVRAQDQDWQTRIGSANMGGVWRTYNATGLKVAQTITATKDWNVTGSDGNDVIIGASSTSTQRGSVAINGGLGNDTITGGGATEEFTVGNGNDVLKSYATGKDKIIIGGAIGENNVYLAGTGLDSNGKTKLTGVLLYDGNKDANDNPDPANSVLLVGMGNGKAVSISSDGGATFANYYFGDGTKTKGAMTFAYESGAYYFANSKQTNTLKVSTDKTKATKTTLGDTVTVDLLAKDGGDVSYYHNIDAIDASASGNRLILAAAEKDTTLKGGTYETTLKGASGSDSLQGGSGADMFWFESLAGSDTITSFTSKNDAIYLGTNEISIEKTETATGDVTIAAAANNADVTLSNGESTITVKGALGATKAIRFSTDGTQTNTLSYYVGSTKANAANNFAATTTADMKLGTDTIIGADGKTTLTAYDFKSYYIGSSATAKDAVKLSALDEKGKVTTAQGAFSLQSSNLSSIDVLDASGLKAGSSIALIGAATGNCTLKGSASNKTNEKFVISSTGTTVVQNLTAAGTAAGTTIGDVIELAAGIGITGTGTQKGANVIYTLDNGGTLQIDGVKLANLTTTTTAGVTTIKRTK